MNIYESLRGSPVFFVDPFGDTTDSPTQTAGGVGVAAAQHAARAAGALNRQVSRMLNQVRDLLSQGQVQQASEELDAARRRLKAAKDAGQRAYENWPVRPGSSNVPLRVQQQSSKLSRHLDNATKAVDAAKKAAQQATQQVAQGSRLVKDILKGKEGAIKDATLPKGSPTWDQISQMTMDQIDKAAKACEPGFRTIRKLLTDSRFDK